MVYISQVEASYGVEHEEGVEILMITGGRERITLNISGRSTRKVKTISDPNILTRPLLSIGNIFKRRMPSGIETSPVPVEVVMPHTKRLINIIL